MSLIMLRLVFRQADATSVTTSFFSAFYLFLYTQLVNVFKSQAPYTTPSKTFLDYTSGPFSISPSFSLASILFDFLLHAQQLKF